MAFLAKVHQGHESPTPDAKYYHVITNAIITKVTYGSSVFNVVEPGYYVEVVVSVYKDKEEKDANLAPLYTIGSSVNHPNSDTNYMFKIPDGSVPINIFEYAYGVMRATPHYKDAEVV